MTKPNNQSVKPKENPLTKLLQRNTESEIIAKTQLTEFTPTQFDDYERLAVSDNTNRTYIKVDLIDVNPEQPRKHFDEQKINELADSIKDIGQIQPIALRQINDRYQLIAGERRLRAVKKCGLNEIMAVIFDVSDKAMSKMALSENVKRVQLSEYEIGCLLHRKKDEYETVVELAEAAGIGRTDVYRYMAFVKLPDWIKQQLEVNPRLFGRSIAESLVSIFSSTEYAADKAMYDETIVQALTKLNADLLTQSVFIDYIKRTVRSLNNPRRLSESVVKNSFLINHKKVGSYVFDVTGLTIKIKGGSLSEENANEIYRLINNIINQQET